MQSLVAPSARAAPAASFWCAVCARNERSRLVCFIRTMRCRLESNAMCAHVGAAGVVGIVWNDAKPTLTDTPLAQQTFAFLSLKPLSCLGLSASVAFILFWQLCRDVSSAVNSARVASSEKELRDLDSSTRSKIREGRDIAKQLDSLAKSFPPKDRRELEDRIKRHRADLDQQSRYFQQQLDSSANTELLSGATTREERERRAKLEGAGGRLDRGTYKLEQSQKLMGESLDMGVHTLDELDDQERSLLRARQAAQGTTSTMAVARRHLMDIISRAWVNKIVLGVIILLLLGADVAILYFRFLQ